jgi:hypothetical protein
MYAIIISLSQSLHRVEYSVYRQRRGAFHVEGKSGPSPSSRVNYTYTMQQQYKPRNRIPWIIIGVCYIVCMLLLLIIRAVLIAENKRRDAAPKVHDPHDNVYVERLSPDGVLEKIKVDKVRLQSGFESYSGGSD